MRPPILLLLAISLSALGGTVPRNDAMVAEVRSGKRTEAKAAWWGYDPADATAALQAAIDSGAKKLIVENLGLGLLDGGNPERARRQQETFTALRNYFVPLAEQRRQHPRNDLLTGLVQARYEGSQLDDDEMLQMLVLLLVAGNETTTTLIGNAAIELMAHPEAERVLRDDLSLLPGAIEEVLRFSSPIQFDPRRVTCDTEICGLALRENDWVLSWLASGNRDERVFDQSDQFDVRRKKNPHLSFGFGLHYCIGANLARLEARVALDAPGSERPDPGRCRAVPVRDSRAGGLRDRLLHRGRVSAAGRQARRRAVHS